MKVIDTERSEREPQRKKSATGRLLHCCCICGKLDVWGDSWSAYYSYKDLDDGKTLPKFCSDKCKSSAGPRAENVTDEMLKKVRAQEFREPQLVWREQTETEKYRDAVQRQRITSRETNSN